MNKVILLGRVGQDPEIKFSADGQKMVTVSMATSKRYTDNTGQKREKTAWHKIVFFGKRADVIETYIKKGSKLLVEGEIQYSEYTDAAGAKKYFTNIMAESFELLGDARPSGEQQEW